MRVVGIAVDIRSQARPAGAVVLLDDSRGAAKVEVCFELTSTPDDLATQLRTLHTSIETRLRGLLPISRAVVRRADIPPRAVNTEGPRLRLLAEGAIIAAVRGVVTDTRIGAGLELGRWHKTDKASVDEAGAALIAAAGVGSGVAERRRLGLAAAAALAGLALGP